MKHAPFNVIALASRALMIWAVFLAGSLFVPAANASLIPVGSDYTIQGVNAPDDFGPFTLTFDGSIKLIDGDVLNVTELQVPTAGGGEWDVFSVSTANGGALAGNINSYWSLGWGFDVAVPSFFDATSIWWTADGVAYDPITAFGGLCCPATNPVNPAWGQAYYNTFPGDPVSGFVTFNPSVFVTPYSFISSGGMDPATANGFSFAFHLMPQEGVPEPASILLLGSGLVVVLCRRLKPA